MSASPIARQATQSQNIPYKRIVVHDPNQLPVDYSSTPGGTLYSTTPGGTRIVYERAFLMNLRNSPSSRTPPKNILTIPTDLLKCTPTIPSTNTSCIKSTKETPIIEESSEQFEMDIIISKTARANQVLMKIQFINYIYHMFTRASIRHSWYY
ncbi:hypothetical protein PV327_005500 [Microctonus hyperodae]|uniref:Uncharacterized protein n=1 Tax=Microctonus hyperodae TaxID=165561 RepID=A0AA39G1G9_MICHY|nr:hypothetical protein PV327_005500 [Microctonus hyperodae]